LKTPHNHFLLPSSSLFFLLTQTLKETETVTETVEVKEEEEEENESEVVTFSLM